MDIVTPQISEGRHMGRSGEELEEQPKTQKEILASTNVGLLLAALQSNDKVSEGEVQHVQLVTKKENLCALCEEFASETLEYILLNKTQNEIITILHKSCFKIPSFKQQCIVLVDYYAPLFFIGVSSINAEDFCQRVNLCEEGISMSIDLPKDKCDLCRTVLVEALLKLKDPDTELEIVEVLLKACNSIGKNVKKIFSGITKGALSKKLVFEYAPSILINAEKFLETNDMCTILHACGSEAVATEEGSLSLYVAS